MTTLNREALSVFMLLGVDVSRRVCVLTHLCSYGTPETQSYKQACITVMDMKELVLLFLARWSEQSCS